MHLFPAVIIGGPPNSGKSVLTYNLSQTLRRRGVQHYVLRANPDGEGDWASEADQTLVRTILVPRRWTPDFVEHVCDSLKQRHLPLLVDIGGRPQSWQEAIFDHCTHMVLLTPDEAGRSTWQALANRHDLLILADLHSKRQGPTQLHAAEPFLTGTISGLSWGQPAGGATFDSLVERLEHLFDYSPDELRRSHLTSAPVETTVDLNRLARSLNVPFEGQKSIWQPHYLSELLEYLPSGKPLGLYGRGPNWLYAAVALHVQPAPFYQFDVRLGWVSPPELSLGLPADNALVQSAQQTHPAYVELNFAITGTYLEYEETSGMIIPVPPQNKILVIGGKIPFWLLTALVLVYRQAPVLAVYQPQVGNVIISSRLAAYAAGDLLA